MPAFLKFKEGVDVSQQAIIAVAYVNACNALGRSGTHTVSSGREGKHMPGSLHGKDRALDFRTRDDSAAQSQEIAAAVKQRLGAGYDVVLESDHLHVEYDPPAAVPPEVVTQSAAPDQSLVNSALLMRLVDIELSVRAIRAQLSLSQK